MIGSIPVSSASFSAVPVPNLPSATRPLFFCHDTNVGSGMRRHFGDCSCASIAEMVVNVSAAMFVGCDGLPGSATIGGTATGGTGTEAPGVGAVGTPFGATTGGSCVAGGSVPGGTCNGGTGEPAAGVNTPVAGLNVPTIVPFGPNTLPVAGLKVPIPGSGIGCVTGGATTGGGELALGPSSVSPGDGNGGTITTPPEGGTGTLPGCGDGSGGLTGGGVEVEAFASFSPATISATTAPPATRTPRAILAPRCMVTLQVGSRGLQWFRWAV